MIQPPGTAKQIANGEKSEALTETVRNGNWKHRHSMDTYHV